MRRAQTAWPYRWLVAIVLLGLTTGIAIAFFTGRFWLGGAVLGTSSATIFVEQLSPTEAFEQLIPGETQQVVWKVTNQGSTELFLAAVPIGEWQNTLLDSQLVQISNVQYSFLNDQNWSASIYAQLSLGDQMFLSEDGTETSLLPLMAGESVYVRAEIGLRSEAGNEYQNEEFTFGVEFIAKQTHPEAQWPVYEHI